jgi:hypothetical protein
MNHRMRSVAIASALLGLTGCAPLELAFKVVDYYTRPPYLYTALPPLSLAEKK